MRAIGEAGYILTKSELCVLAGLTGAGNLIGIDLKMPVDDDNKLSIEIELVKRGLVEKKYLHKIEDGLGLGVDKHLFFLIKACCYPLAFARLIVCNGEGKANNRYYYFHEDVIVEMDEDLLLKNTFILTPMTSVGKARQNMEEFLQMDQIDEKLEDKSTGGNCYLDRKLVKQMMDFNGVLPEHDVEDMLSNAGLDGQLAKDLIYAISVSNKSFSILMLTSGVKRTYISSNTYAGRKLLWNITETYSDEDQIKLSYGTKEDYRIIERFIEIIRNSVPKENYYVKESTLCG